MKKKDFIYTDPDGYRIRVVSLSSDNPKRLLLIPSLVGASGGWAIKTFRSFLREGCLLVSFDFCGHCNEIGNKFTLDGTFRDTKAAIVYASEYSRKNGMPAHVAGACFGLIPLIYCLESLGWPKEIKSIFSVNGLLSLTDVLKFNDYLFFLKKRGFSFKDKGDFIAYMSANRKMFIYEKRKYMDALTEYLLVLFAELSEIISFRNFGILKYSKVDFYQTFYEFMINELPPVKIPKHFPCLFFTGTKDAIFNLNHKEGGYSPKATSMASHARILNISVDHFGHGKDHCCIPKEGSKFLVANEKDL